MLRNIIALVIKHVPCKPKFRQWDGNFASFFSVVVNSAFPSWKLKLSNANKSAHFC